MACACGNTEFTAHQVCHLDVIVGEDNIYVRSFTGDTDKDIYYAAPPFGPYSCTKCGKEYNELPAPKER